MIQKRKLASLEATVLVLVLLLLVRHQPRSTLHARNGDAYTMTQQMSRKTNYEDVRSDTFSSSVHYSGLPKVDEILFRAYPGVVPEFIVSNLLAGVVDWIDGPGRIDLYDIVVAAGHKVSSMNPVAEFMFFSINCRDYKQTSWKVNLPLNDSSFRVALSYIYGVDQKQEDIFSYVGAPWVTALDNPVPPAQKPWYNESVRMPDTNWTVAWSMLEGAGYYVNTTENWLYRNGVRIRNMTVLCSTGSLFWERGPGGGFVRAFNEFITTHLGANGPLMTLSPIDFISMIYDLLVYHNYDFICIGLTGLGRYVDWLYDVLHSFNDRWWGSNYPGIHDDDLDRWLEIIVRSLNVDEIIYAASKVQEIFVLELMPWFPISTGSEFCTTARDGRGELTNIVSMPNFGPRNSWSWMTVHWRGEPGVTWPGGSVKAALEDEPDTLNPYTEYSPSGWQILDRTKIGLTIVEPRTFLDMPFVATDWNLSYWTSIPELGVYNGTMATFYLRQDVTWHDGRPVTAYDCVNNMRILREYELGKYLKNWINLVYEEAEGPYKFNAYFYTPGLYYPLYVSANALIAPKHIINLVEKQVEDGLLVDFHNWDPAFNSYKALTGEDPPEKYPFMKQLVGCGPFVFDYYDRIGDIGRVARYEEFFVNAPVIGAVAGEWRIDPETPYMYRVLVQNVAAHNDTEMGELVPVTFDVRIYEDDVLAYTLTDVTLDAWEWSYLGPYTTSVLAGGEHTIKVEIYESENLIHTYTHTFQVVPREDISTYTGDLVDWIIDIKDILRAAIAYGSYPGSFKWDAACDVNDDYFVDIKDILSVATKFGWHA